MKAVRTTKNRKEWANISSRHRLKKDQAQYSIKRHDRNSLKKYTTNVAEQEGNTILTLTFHLLWILVVKVAFSWKNQGFVFNIKFYTNFFFVKLENLKLPLILQKIKDVCAVNSNYLTLQKTL